jgi:hypothetical protein
MDESELESFVVEEVIAEISGDEEKEDAGSENDEQ